MNTFRNLNSQASHFQKIPQFNLTDHSNPHPENRPLYINHYNQVSTDFKIDARFIIAGIWKQKSHLSAGAWGNLLLREKSQTVILPNLLILTLSPDSPKHLGPNLDSILKC